MDEKVWFAREARVVYAKNAGERVKGPIVTDSRVAAEQIRHAIYESRGEPLVEHFVVLLLNARNRVVGWSTVAIGHETACPVSTTHVARIAILAGAQAIVLGHNHPSGGTEPSPDDIALTQRVCEVTKTLGIKMLDHIIIAEDEYSSFLDAGLLK